MKTYALDFESYYDKECSISVLGPLGYFSHPDFDAYMVSVVGDDGYVYVGHPKEFDWSILEGNRVLSHNAAFDETLYLFGIGMKWWDEVDYAEWHCTADMAAYCGHPRNLKGASKAVLGIDLSKETRDTMKGQKWDGMDSLFKEEVLEYATKDSEYCLALWQKLEPLWPKKEREISVMNRKAAQGGIPVDSDYVEECIATLNKELFLAEQNIPWIGEKKLLSRAAFNDECRKNGLVPPASLAKDNEETERWFRAHSKKFLWIGATRNWRRINALKKKMLSFRAATMQNGRYYGGLMYWGAHTGRFSGSGGNLNLQNMPRGELFGVDMRKVICAPKGKKLVVVDLSQIEVRTLSWLSGDSGMLKRIEESDDIYEAFAIQFGLWDESKGSLKKEDPSLRHTVKTMALGCGYGVGAKRFSEFSGTTEKEAAKSVALYRSSLPKVTRYWRDLNDSLNVAYDSECPFEISLPSGRKLRYGSLYSNKTSRGIELVAKITKGSNKVAMKLWGGILAENAASALARDIFTDAMLRIRKEGYWILFHVHDEVVVEVDEDKAEKALEDITRILSTPPEWISKIPLEAEGKILQRYEK